MTMESNRNLVMGFAHGYGIGDIHAFYCTLRDSGYLGEIVLFTDKIGLNDRKRLLTNQKVTCIHKNHQLYRQVIIANSFIKDWSPNLYRYLVYEYYLSQQNVYGNVFISDVRDVIFQGNIDTYPIEDGVQIFLENDQIKIGLNEINRNWVKDSFGINALEQIGENTVSCSGFTFGGFEPMKRYLRLMNETFLDLHNLGKSLSGGIDQGVHNFLLYTNRIDEVTIHPNKHFGVITCGYETDLKIEDGLVKDRDNQTFWVVHQYDRHPLILKYFNSKYSIEREPAILSKFRHLFRRWVSYL